MIAVFFILRNFVNIYAEEIIFDKGYIKDISFENFKEFNRPIELAICFENDKITVPSTKEITRQGTANNVNIIPNRQSTQNCRVIRDLSLRNNLQQDGNPGVNHSPDQIADSDESSNISSCCGIFCSGFVLCFSFLFD